jgi:hypothetical protein
VKEFKIFKYRAAWVIQNIIPRLRSEAIHNLEPTFVSPYIPKSIFYNGNRSYFSWIRREGRDLVNHPYLALRSGKVGLYVYSPSVSHGTLCGDLYLYLCPRCLDCLESSLLHPVSVLYNTRSSS